MAISQIANNSLATGVPSAAKLPAGSVLQVVSAVYTSAFSTTSQTPSDTGLTANITPSSASNKVLILIRHPIYVTGNVLSFSQYRANAMFRLLANGSQVFTGGADASGGYSETISSSANTTVEAGGIWSLAWLDFPATTSAVTYKTQLRVGLAGMTAYGTQGAAYEPASIILMEIAV